MARNYAYPVGIMVRVLDAALVSNGRNDWPDAFRGAVVEVIGYGYNSDLQVRRPDGHSWFISSCFVELAEPIKIIDVKPYPHKCKKCKAPGRKCGQVFLCSNLKCKTRTKFSRHYYTPAVKIAFGSTQANPIKIWCESCNRLADYMTARLYREESGVIRSRSDSLFGCYTVREHVTPFTYEVGLWYQYSQRTSRLRSDGMWYHS